VIRFCRNILSTLWMYPLPVLLVLVLLGLIGLMGVYANSYIGAARHYRAAQQALAQHDLAGARQHLDECLKVWSGSAETHLLAARTARRAGAYDDAESHLKQYERLGGVPEEVQLERSLAKAQRGELKGVEAPLVAFAREENNPDAIIILEALTRGYMRTYQLLRAQDCLERWLALAPDDAEALVFRGDVRRFLRNRDEALADYLRALDLDPDQDEARLQAAEILIDRHQADDALRHLEFLRDRQPDRVEVLLGLAQCDRLLNRRKEAVELVDGVLKANPKNLEALRERGRLAWEMADPARAATLLRRVVERAPYDRSATFWLANCLDQLSQPEEAKQYRAQLKVIEEQMRRLDELTRLITQSPHDAALRHEAGVIFLDSGQPVEGLRWLQSALIEDPYYQPTHLKLADYYDSINEKALAAQHRQLAMQGALRPPVLSSPTTR
jgi:tetratricopeptide (TPR) repeat protein